MKYMGSKARFSKHILPLVLMDRTPDQYYVEPFAGGMNIICDVKGKRIANDIHTNLIAMWKKLMGGWIPNKITREEYIDIKNNPYKYPDWYVGWVGFNCSYSGKWFGGFAGETKTKDGGVRDYQAEAIKNVLSQVKKMDGVIFQNKPFFEMEIPSNSIVYCDPPYEGTTKYRDDFDHVRFWEWVRESSRRGNTIFVSEYNAPNDFECIWQKEAKSSLSANGVIGGNKLSVEKLFIPIVE